MRQHHHHHHHHPQGVQCDFDDGFCPSWRNVLLAVHNIALASRGELAYPHPQVVFSLSLSIYIILII